ncbi:MAG: RHS repeat-associated core domain-containing protein [Anaerolineales bacterium]
MDGSDGTWREGFLVFEATRTDDGTYLHSTFTLGDVPTESATDTAQGVIKTGSCTNWSWSSVPGSRVLTGSTSGTSASFPSFAGAPTYNFDHQQVRMEISQKIMLESEAFQARLELDNTSDSTINDVSVEIIIEDPNGFDRTAGFEFIPEVPTGLGNIPVGGGAEQEWILLPSLLNVTDPEGEDFFAYARITYTWGGQTFFTETVPELITVYPSPDLVITYQLPLPPNVCTEFPLKVTIQNRGEGPARNLRFSTALPQVVDPDSGITIPFTITETLVNGVSVGPKLNVEVGDVPPDPEQPATIVWVLKTTVPGRFVEFTSDFRQINPLGLPLEPLISEVRTFFVPGPCGEIPDRAVFCPSGECPGIALNGAVDTVEGPINTRTGGQSFEATDFSFPTAAGPLTFDRWYASPTVEEYTKLLGYGWTHSLDSRLIFPDDPLGEPGVVQLKLHSSNRLDFIEIGEGQYQAYPGVCGSLERLEDGSYLFTDNAQNAYAFDSQGHIHSLTDPQGNLFLYNYTSEGLLYRVSDASGDRFLQFSYDLGGRIEQIEDHTGRTVSYAYDEAGDLVAVTDVLDQVWTYVYDDAHRMVEAIDPGEVTIERTVYDAEGRAVEQYDGEGNRVVALTYNPDGTTTITDANGNTRLDEYDERGALVDQTDPLGASMTKSYDQNFRPTELTDPAGNATVMNWSETGANLLGVEDALGNQISLSYDELNNLTGIVDAQGQQTVFNYQDILLTSTTDALGNTTTYTYTPEGYLASVTDALGNTTSYTYDVYGQRTSMTDAVGSTWTYTYDDLGRLIESADPLGRVTRNEYDALGRLVKTIRNYDPLREQNEENQYNITSEYIYDSCCNVSSVFDTYGQVYRYSYDLSDRIVLITDPMGQSTSFEYDEVGNLIGTVDPLGRTAILEYDEFNRLIRTVDPMGGVWRNTYDIQGNIVSSIDALGYATSFDYDPLNRPIVTTNALGGRTTTEYDANGNITSITDPEGRTYTYQYDAMNRLVTQIDPEGGTIWIEYDEVGNRSKLIDPNGNVTEFVYDALNRLVVRRDALGGEQHYTYDAVGNLLSTTDQNGQVFSYSYDGLNRTTSTINPLLAETQRYYDSLGNVIVEIDPLGRQTSFEYDPLNRLVRKEDPTGGITAYSYDAVGNLTSVIDPRGHATSTVYDALNRPITYIDPNSQTTTLAYSPVGNLLSNEDPLGNVTQYFYDPLGRQTSMINPLGDTTIYNYDAVGNKVAKTNANGITNRFEFDGLNQLTAVVENYIPEAISDAETNVRTEFTFDRNGNRVAIKDANGNTSTFVYDALNRLIQERDPLGNITSYSYDLVGNQIAFQDAEGYTTHFEYDAANQLIKIDYPDPDHDVLYSYDASGNRTDMVDGLGVTTWSYDDLDRPVEIEDPFGNVVGYTYDPIGNRTAMRYPDGKTASYTYDPANRLTQVTDWQNQVTSYGYDAAGRLIEALLPNGVRSSHQYDSNGQVLEIRHENQGQLLSSYSYSYDDVGNRVQAVEVMNWPGEPEQAMVADPLTVGLVPFALLILLPVMRRSKPKVPGSLILIVLLSSATLAVSACMPTPTPPPPPTPTPTPTPSPTPTPLPDTSVISEVVEAARETLEDLVGSEAVDRIAGRILDQRLTLAERFLGMGMEDRAEQQLEIFLRTVERYRGTRITEEAADTLTEEVQPIVDALEREALEPSVYCVEETATGWIGHFGVYNPNAETVDVPVGPLNRFQPAPEDRGQSTSFDPGTDEELFTVSYEETELTWQLDGNSTTSSAESPRCELPTPTPTPTPIPVSTTTTIDYTYDPLNRLTAADYSTGEFFHYTYDAVGNRLTEQTDTESKSYLYDAANRIISVNGKAYTWDARGNLLNDGENIYAYDHAGRLISAIQGSDTYSFAYNGLGDRMQQTVNGITNTYTLDLTGVLSQVLDDGVTTYLYGIDRIAQQQTGGWSYFLNDAISSVRQLNGAQGDITFAQAYEPFGGVLKKSGIPSTNYGFAGEWTDGTGLVHLRARYYQPEHGRFFQPDPFSGFPQQPGSLHPYSYVLNNPVLFTDPSGQIAPAIAWAAVVALAGVTGGILGGLLSAGFAAATYNWALDGECGCEMQQVVSGYTHAGWVWYMAKWGALIGAVAGAIAAAAPVGAIIVGGFGLVASAVDLLKTIYIGYTETGLTWCVALRFTLDVVGLVMSAAAIRQGIQGWKESGSPWRWKPSELEPTTPVTRDSRIDPFIGVEGESASGLRSRIPMDWEMEFDYYSPPSDPSQSIPQYKFTSPDGNVQLRMHGPQAGFEDTWVARVGMRVTADVEGAVQNPFKAGEYWLYYDNMGIPTDIPSRTHIRLNVSLDEMMSVFGR